MVWELLVLLIALNVAVFCILYDVLDISSVLDLIGWHRNDFLMLIILLFFFALPVLVLFVSSLFGFKIVRHKEKIIVEKWGKFDKLLEPGLHYLIPFRDKAKVITWRERREEEHVNVVVNKKFSRVDLRMNIWDFPFQMIITRDNVEIGVHPMLVYELHDPIRIAYETFDLNHAVEKLVQTTLRSIIGNMGLDDTLASREEINRGIMLQIYQVCYNWGIKVHRVELLEINPTPSVQEAMHNQLRAERVRRGQIVTAAGYREKVKTEAEGNCQSTIALATATQQCSIIEAKSRAEAKILLAKAEAEALSVIGKSLVGNSSIDADQYMIALKYMDTIMEVASNAKSCEVYMPYETNLGAATNQMNCQT